jgi:sarcosine oxidase
VAAEAVDVAVIGAGAMGAAAAWRLAGRGRSVVVLERFGEAHDRGSSHGRERIFRYGYADARYVALAQEARPLWHRLEDEAGVALFAVTGCVDLGPPGELAGMRAVLERAGIACEVVPGAEVGARWPGIAVEGAALVQPDAGRVDAEAAVRAALAVARRHGAEVRFDEPVRRVAVTGAGVDVETDGGRWRASTAVLAAGAWSAELAARALPGHRLPPITVTDEVVAFFDPVDPGATWPSLIDRYPPVTYALGSPSGRVKAGEHGSGRPVHPDRRPPVEDPALDRRVLAWVERRLPGVVPEIRHRTTCLYASTPTEDFVIDRVGPVVVAAGFSGHGFKFAPAVGERLARLALGEAVPGPHWPLGSAAGTLPPSGHR